MNQTHEDLAAVVGKNASSPEVKRLLAALGGRRAPQLAKAGSVYLDQAYLALPKLGLQLSFDLPAKRKPSKANEKYLRVARIEFWRGDPSKDMPNTFPGRLPFDISFSDDQKTVRAKVGKPSRTANDPWTPCKLDYWETQTPKLYVCFGKSSPKATRFKLDLVVYYA